jgi:hypothetical protein
VSGTVRSTVAGQDGEDCTVLWNLYFEEPWTCHCQLLFANLPTGYLVILLLLIRPALATGKSSSPARFDNFFSSSNKYKDQQQYQVPAQYKVQAQVPPQPQEPGSSPVKTFCFSSSCNYPRKGDFFSLFSVTSLSLSLSLCIYAAASASISINHHNPPWNQSICLVLSPPFHVPTKYQPNLLILTPNR